MTSSSGIAWRGEIIGIGPCDDADLVAKFKAGDRAVFDEIVRRHQAFVTRLAHRLLGWRGDEVEDVVQEVFLAALVRLKSLRSGSSLAGWLRTVTVNKCRTVQRTHRLRDLLKRRTRSEPFASPEACGLEDNEKSSRVRQAVQSLPLRYREVVVLRYLEELSTAEVSRAVGLSPNAVQVRLHRARARLRETLGNLMEA